MRPTLAMSMRFAQFASSLIFATLLAGCVTETTFPEDQVYQVPQGNDVARLQGAQITDTGLFAAKHTGFVMMVDRKFVKNAEENWNAPLALAPGWHEISVEYRQSVFKGRAVFKLDVEAGARYALKIEPGAVEDSDARWCDISIINAATGKPVLPVKRANVSGSANRYNFRPLD